MNPQDDARRFEAAIIRECGDQALNVVEQRIRLLEFEQRQIVAQLWREVADAIKRLQGVTRALASDRLPWLTIYRMRNVAERESAVVLISALVGNGEE